MVINLGDRYCIKIKNREPVATFVRSGYSARRSLGEGGLKQSECESESEHTRSVFSLPLCP